MLPVARRFQVGIAHRPLHAIGANHGVACHRYARHSVLLLIGVAQLQAMGDVVRQRHLGTESPEVVPMVILGVMDIACTRPQRVAQLAKHTLNFGKGIQAVVVRPRQRGGVAQVVVLGVFGTIVQARRDRERPQPVLIDDLREQGSRFAIHIILVGRPLVIETAGLRGDIGAYSIGGKRLARGDLAEEIKVQYWRMTLVVIPTRSPIVACAIHDILDAIVVRGIAERSGQRSLKDGGSRVGPVVGEFGVLPHHLAQRLHIVSLDSIETAIGQGISRQLHALAAPGPISTHTIRKRPFALATVPLAVHHAITLQGGKRRGQVCADRIATLTSARNYIDNIGYTLAITNSRIVDEVDLHDVLRIERQHLLLAHHDTIDSQLNLAPVVNSRDGMVDMVDAKVGKRELLEDAEAIVGTLLLSVGRIDEQACTFAAI